MTNPFPLTSTNSARHFRGNLKVLWPVNRAKLLQRITNNESRAFDTWWDVFAHSHQRPPDGDWATWLILGGRGAGKTRAGAEWVRELALRHANARIALVGETEHDAREVMVEGICGVLAVHRRDERPE